MRGIDPSEVDARERRKSISSERTFFEDVGDDEELERRLLGLCCSVGGQLRAKELRARTVTVKIRDHDFRTRQAGSTQIEGNRDGPGVVRGRLLPAGRAPAPSQDGSAAAWASASPTWCDSRQRRRSSSRDRRRRAEWRCRAGGPSSRPSAERTIARAVDQVRQRFGRQALRPAGCWNRRSAEPGSPTVCPSRASARSSPGSSPRLGAPGGASAIRLGQITIASRASPRDQMTPQREDRAHEVEDHEDDLVGAPPPWRRRGSWRNGRRSSSTRSPSRSRRAAPRGRRV